MIKTIKIKDDVHRKLLNIGHKGETFNDIINRLIEQNRR
jgi:predicted CopG family antitoxin